MAARRAQPIRRVEELAPSLFATGVSSIEDAVARVTGNGDVDKAVTR